MSWGAFWMFYQCPACGAKFRWDLGTVSNPQFGCCPTCGQQGVLVGESSDLPANQQDYPDCSE